MDYKPDTISVQASANEHIAADHADFLVTIRGTSFIVGNAALQKAQEVRHLINELATVGVTESSVTLVSVHAETSSGMVGKVSHARYTLRINCSHMDLFANAFGIITAQKNVQIERVVWKYPDLEAIHLRLLEASLRTAQSRAQLIANTLGCRIVAVHEVSERLQEGETHDMPSWMHEAPLAQSAMRSRSAAPTADELGLATTHTKEITVTASVVYRIEKASRE